MTQTQTLKQIVSQDGYSARAIDVIQRIAAADDQAAVLELLREAKGALDVEQAVFASFIRDDDFHESFRFLLACDPQWCFEYLRQNWYAIDPWLLYAATHSEPVRSSEIHARTKAQRQAVALALRFGIASACVVPAPASGGLSRLGVLVLGQSQEGFFEGDGFPTLKVLARSLAMELNEWWVRQARKQLIQENRISQEDIELLNFQRRGLGSKEVASDLGVTTASVDSRWQRLNAKLGVPNRSAAARLAAEYGVI